MTSKGRTVFILGLVALLALSAGIRFYKLGATDTRSDEVELVEQLQGGIRPAEYFKWFIEVFQAGRQMPLSRVATCIYIRTFDLPVTLFHVRTPFAVLSALTPLFLVCLGRWWTGPRLGWILGVLGLTVADVSPEKDAPSGKRKPRIKAAYPYVDEAGKKYPTYLFVLMDFLTY